MTVTKYNYSVSVDFPNEKVDLDSLTLEIGASDIAIDLSYITSEVDPEAEVDNCDIWFAEILSAGDKTILDAIVAAHQGNPPMSFGYKAPSKLVLDAKSVTEDQSWQELGGAVTNLSSFVSNVSNAWGRCTGEVKVSGSGAQLRVVRGSDGAQCMATPLDVADTSGDWSIFGLWANTNQPVGNDSFILQGRLNGATSMEVRYTAISILEKLT